MELDARSGGPDCLTMLTARTCLRHKEATPTGGFTFSAGDNRRSASVVPRWRSYERRIHNGYSDGGPWSRLSRFATRALSAAHFRAQASIPRFVTVKGVLTRFAAARASSPDSP